MSKPESRQARLLRSVALTPQVLHLEFEVIDRPKFEFDPGQYVCLMKELEGKLIRRYYSIASAPDGTNCFELCVGAGKEAGVFHHFLAQAKPGEALEFQGPGGSFLLRQPACPSVFVAQGTGIAPIRSMLHYLLGNRGAGRNIPLTLIYGARTPAGLHFREEFEQLEKRHPNFSLRPTLSRPPSDWSGRRGYVQTHLADALGNRTSGVDVYLCGSREMVWEARTDLLQRGFDEGSIIYEKCA